MSKANRPNLVLSDSDLWALLSLLQAIQEIRSTDFGSDPEAVAKLTGRLGAAVLQSDLYCFGTQIEPAIREIENQLRAKGWEI